jgi:protein-disulfide isomerase
MSQRSIAKLVKPVGPDDHVRGSKAAAVTLLEYGDYQCPYCGAAYPVVEQLREWAGDNLRFVFRNFPLTQAHPFAEGAAEAAEASGAQGKYWEMHDTLYTHQDALDLPDLLEYAAALGLDVRAIAADLSARRYQDRVHQDFLGGVRSGVNGTPTFFMDGLRYDGPPDFESLSAALEQAARASEG